MVAIAWIFSILTIYLFARLVSFPTMDLTIANVILNIRNGLQMRCVICFTTHQSVIMTAVIAKEIVVFLRMDLIIASVILNFRVGLEIRFVILDITYQSVITIVVIAPTALFPTTDLTTARVMFHIRAGLQMVNVMISYVAGKSS